MIHHTPVLYHEVLKLLIKNPDGVYVDCTMGEGGHSRGILEKLSPKGTLISLDQDSEMVVSSLQKYPDQSCWMRIQENFRNLKATLNTKGIDQVDGILADLGLSMFHYKASSGGFSFAKDDPLDMSLSRGDLTAQKIVNHFSLEELKTLFWEYAQEPHAHRIASFIIFYRERVGPIKTTRQLSDIVFKALDSLPGPPKGHLHPATKTFQALRIAVNDEMGALKDLLEASLSVLKKGGRGVFISYHSLEDRMVKNFLSQHQNKFKILQKKPIIPTEEEILNNKASRSAKLRFFERL